MRVSGEEVRRQLGARPTAQLKKIVVSTGQYTADARQAAAEELQRREEAKENARNARPQPHAASYRLEDAIFDRFRVPSNMPQGIQILFGFGVAAVGYWLTLLVFALFVYLFTR